jgi:hypothetical protein
MIVPNNTLSSSWRFAMGRSSILGCIDSHVSQVVVGRHVALHGRIDDVGERSMELRIVIPVFT